MGGSRARCAHNAEATEPVTIGRPAYGGNMNGRVKTR